MDLRGAGRCGVGGRSVVGGGLMLKLNLLPDRDNNYYRIAIDPDSIKSVVESIQRPPGYDVKFNVCIITMFDGELHTVLDRERKVMQLICDAKMGKHTIG